MNILETFLVINVLQLAIILFLVVWIFDLKISLKILSRGIDYKNEIIDKLNLKNKNLTELTKSQTEIINKHYGKI